MLLIQIILLVIIAFILLRLFLKLQIREITWRQFFGWAIFWLVALMVVIRPELSIVAANFVGIGRGADLVIYSSLILLFYLVWKLFLRLSEIDKKITKIVRQLALEDYDKRQND